MFKCCSSSQESKNADGDVNVSLNDQTNNELVTVIILDLTNVEFIDDSAFKVLNKCFNDYKSDGIQILLTNCHGR